MILPDAALFDFDGTLIDREPLVELAVVRACRAQGFEPADGSILIGRAWQDLHADLGVGPALGWSVPDLVDRARAEAALLVAEGHEPRRIEGGAELMARLAGHGVAIAIVSGSTRAELADGIGQLGVAHLLHHHLGAEDYSAGKPHPEGFLLAAQRIGADPARCVVFEDSTVGVAAGLAAGMRVVAVSQANRPPGHPGHQDLGSAHRVVPDLRAVTDDLLAEVLALAPSEWSTGPTGPTGAAP